MPDLNELPDVSELNTLETNFKVYAGPGAGKTSWLIEHLERVLKKSTRLERTRQIACITYTNVAAEELIGRLDCDKSRFDISTIHSFLYRNIVKPFSYLIEYDDNGEELFDVSNLDGHEEHVVHGDRLRRWINTLSGNYNYLQWSQNKPNVVVELSSLDYEFDDDGKVQLIVRARRGARIPKSNGELWIYKSKYWSDGIMHHEDVLYFSYLILSKYPSVIKLIRNKFPYIFVDEFQDTTQLQTWILDKISEQHTVIGVVGDLAQSIYRFTGAQRNDFITFKNGDISAFKLGQNHRSTTNIIDFLNMLRSDIQQDYGDEEKNGGPVVVLVGTPKQSMDWFSAHHDDKDLYILTRKNTSVYQISSQIGSSTDDRLNEMYLNDSNAQRASFIHSIFKGLKFHDKHDYLNSVKEIVRHLKRVNDGSVLKIELRDIAIGLLTNLDENQRQQTIYDLYTDLRSEVSDKFGITIGSGLRSGNAKTFYENNTVNDLLPHVKVDTRSDDKVRTIHSAKGTEFENTLVHFETLSDFKKYILDAPSYLENDEDDGRIFYVACSRAMENLFINIPEINESDMGSIKEVELQLHYLDS
ncbi:ATP-dependent helicase [Gracilimonas sp.]|uniref:ATP-dependent helicase n=1 Tax=Gracilimonas sp. TaxID=1974203 RepID=UPI0032EDC0CE